MRTLKKKVKDFFSPAVKKEKGWTDEQDKTYDDWIHPAEDLSMLQEDEPIKPPEPKYAIIPPKKPKKIVMTPIKKPVQNKRLYEEETTMGILDDGAFEESDQRATDDNPFKELENLITSKDINVKTFLTDRQVVVMHKLETLYQIYATSGEQASADMIRNYARQFMTLIINKGGLSRSQFIEAIGKGREKVEEARREKAAAMMGQFM